jgi:hypothetical protein
MNLRIFPRNAGRAGYTLLTTLILTGAITAMLAATLSRTMTGEKLNDRDNAWQSANAAAEAATEKVLSRMMVDFAAGGELSLSNNLSLYQTGMLPNTNESSFWTNVVFSDGNGNSNATYVHRTTTTPNPPYVTLEQQYPGLSAFAATYRILSNAKYTYNGYNITGVVQQDVQMAEIPVFQFAIFYNTLLEFSDCATMTVNGRVHCNTNINVGSPSALVFNYLVDCSGIITNPPAMGLPQSSWTTPTVYNGTPSPGYGTGEPVLNLPVGTNSGDPNSVREIINPPPAGESQTNPISPQRYYNKAWMIVVITNAYVPSSTNMVLVTNANWVMATNAVFVTIKNTMYDTSPLTFAVTNGVQGLGISNGINFTAEWAAWTNAGFNSWINMTNLFVDQRQSSSNHVVQIDVGKLGSWIGTTTNGCNNSNLTSKWNSTTPFNGIVYIQDLRNTANPTNTWMNCVRLVDGQNITNGLYSSGLSLATQNPVYIMGLYNCPNSTTNVSSTNTTACRPCSVVCDALTILSPAWTNTGVNNYDDISMNNYTTRPALDDTVNCAMITGNVLTTDTTATGFSGGVHNLTRLLEDWSAGGGRSLWLNTSIICLYTSVQANAQFQKPTIYYAPPTRHFSFDLNYTTSTGLPPGTPLIDRMIRAGWGIAPPNIVNYYSPTLDFVPH